MATSNRFPLLPAVSEAYADAVLLARSSGGYASIGWNGGEFVTDFLESGSTPDDAPVVVGHSMVTYYPWAPDGLQCVAFSPDAARDDIIRCVTESGEALRIARVLSRSQKR